MAQAKPRFCASATLFAHTCAQSHEIFPQEKFVNHFLGENMLTIKSMTKQDTENILKMMRTFYASEAVFTNGSEEIFINDIENCIGPCPYLEGYVFFDGDSIAGYAMIAKSFSTEFGKPCIWLEDIFVKQEFQGRGIGTKFLIYIEQKYPNCILRLEVEEENRGAVNLYKKCGYDILPYMQMKKIPSLD